MAESNSKDDDDKEPDVIYSINGFVAPISSLRIDVKREGEVIAHRESGAIRQSSDSTVQLDGTVLSVLRGSPAQGEQATEEVCRALAQTLRARGAGWHPPQLAAPHDDCDCITATIKDASAVRIQVVRADSSPESWSALAREGVYGTLSQSTSDPANALRNTIEKKADRIPVQQRRSLILALDATSISALALGPVVRTFRERFEAWTKQKEFAAVWLVGPSAETTYRLDERDTKDLS